MRIRLNPVLLLPLLATAAACDAIDPYRREGVWRPAGVNEQNLAVMAARPEERVRGTGAEGAIGFIAAGAVERLRADKVKPLPDTGLARIVTIPGGNQGSGY
jgi:hypothetical protein